MEQFENTIVVMVVDVVVVLWGLDRPSAKHSNTAATSVLLTNLAQG